MIRHSQHRCIVTDTEYHALPSADAALNPVPPVAPDRVPLTEGGHQGRTPGSGKLNPNAHRFVEIIGKKVDSFYVDKGRWPTRQEAIDYGEWSDHKPSGNYSGLAIVAQQGR